MDTLHIIIRNSVAAWIVIICLYAMIEYYIKEVRNNGEKR